MLYCTGPILNSLLCVYKMLVYCCRVFFSAANTVEKNVTALTARCDDSDNKDLTFPVTSSWETICPVLQSLYSPVLSICTTCLHGLGGLDRDIK